MKSFNLLKIGLCLCASSLFFACGNNGTSDSNDQSDSVAVGQDSVNIPTTPDSTTISDEIDSMVNKYEESMEKLSEMKDKAKDGKYKETEEYKKLKAECDSLGDKIKSLGGQLTPEQQERIKGNAEKLVSDTKEAAKEGYDKAKKEIKKGIDKVSDLAK